MTFATPSELYRAITRIFLEVCDLPVPERGPALDRACGGDAELREGVEALLRYHDAKSAGGDR
jgi:hypothetical protein